MDITVLSIRFNNIWNIRFSNICLWLLLSNDIDCGSRQEVFNINKAIQKTPSNISTWIKTRKNSKKRNLVFGNVSSFGSLHMMKQSSEERVSYFDAWLTTGKAALPCSCVIQSTTIHSSHGTWDPHARFLPSSHCLDTSCFFSLKASNFSKDWCLRNSNYFSNQF